jgi:hypothetical protein
MGTTTMEIENMKGKLEEFYRRLAEHAEQPDGTPMPITPAEARSIIEARRQRDLLGKEVDRLRPSNILTG